MLIFTNKKWQFSLILFLFFAFQSFAQLPVNYSPLPIDSTDEIGIKHFKEIFNKEKDTISISDAKSRKYVVEQCSLRCDLFRRYVVKRQMLTFTYADSILNRISAQIITSNPSIKGKVMVYVNRSLIPNAYCLGNGLVIFNIGLLSRMENEAQIAFILCHEFSHQLMNNSNDAIYKYAIRSADKTLKRQIKSTLKEEYNVTEKLEKLILPGLLADQSYSRSEELKADSMGLVFLKNTPYDLTAALTTMDILDRIDGEANLEPLDMRTFFTLPQVTPGKYWFNEQESSLGLFEAEAKDTLEDSLKTHPDCKLRKELLSKYIYRCLDFL